MSEPLTPLMLPADHVDVAGRAGYTLEAVFGAAGLGVVYRARHRRLDRVVAVKMIPSGHEQGPVLRQRLAWEASVLARLHSPGVVPLHDFGEIDGQPYLVLEFPAGGTLASQLHPQGVPPATAVEIARTVARALDDVHRKGFVHRDVKPANLWRLADGSLRLADFLIARALSGEGPAEREGEPIGTPAYMAPEQAAGLHAGTGPAADLYSLGVLLVEMLTGHRPTPAWPGRASVDAPPPLPSRLRAGIPSALDAVVLQCLAREPDQRFASAAALGRALDLALPPTPPPFPYEQLLAFTRGELSPPDRALVEAHLATEPRWRAHLESLRQIDLERIAARQDGRELRGFLPARATRYCRAVAQSGAAVLASLLRQEGDTLAGHPVAEWQQHIDRCVYCRRMNRLTQARLTARAHGLPEGELLMRDWLLGQFYRDVLDQITSHLQVAPPSRRIDEPAVAGEGSTVLGIAEDETVILPAGMPAQPVAQALRPRAPDPTGKPAP